jgi:hypothetical protein
VLWIDDYAPQPSARDAQDQERKAQRVVRAQGNLSGRTRMRPDITLRPQYYPRGLVFSTGELHPSGSSTFARLLQLNMTKDDIRLDRLTACQAEAHWLPEAMAAYIAWLQPQAATLKDLLPARRDVLRAQALTQTTGHTRNPEVFANLMTAWELVLHCAEAHGALTAAARDTFEWMGRDTLLTALNAQQADREADDPVRRFIGQLHEAISREDVYLPTPHELPPPDAEHWGWRFMPAAPGAGEGIGDGQWRPAPTAQLLGWVDDLWLYLLPDATYRLVAECLQRMNLPLLPQTALWKLLVEGHYVQTGKTSTTTVKKINGQSMRVLKVNRYRFEQIGEEE